MDIVVGTSAGAFLGDSAGSGVDGRVIRQLIQANGDVFAAASDGVYRSSDGGRSWARSGVDAGEVWTVAASPHAASCLYAGTQPAHLFVSRDGGSSWEEVPTFLQAPGAERWCVPNSPQGARALTCAFDPFDARHFWVGVEVGGVIATADGGSSWSVAVPCGNADVHLLAAHPSRKGVVFAMTGYGRNDGAPMDPRMAGPYCSLDGGAAWRYLGDGMAQHYTRPMCVDARPPHVLTVPAVPDVRSSVHDAGGAQSVLYRSEDDGQTWRSLGDAAHSPSAQRLTAVASDPSVPDGVIVGTETGEVWRVTADCVWTLLCDGLPAVVALLALR
jgi:photosystem II stability/assembly factor-like uncharacterized protein